MIDLDRLRRHPDLEAPGLQASDAADRLVLDHAADALAETAPGEVTVIDDAYGALALAAVDAGARDIRVHQDPITVERALAANDELSTTGLVDEAFCRLLGKDAAVWQPGDRRTFFGFAIASSRGPSADWITCRRMANQTKRRPAGIVSHHWMA